MEAGEGGLFIYCQSAFGVGHFVRMHRLIHALQRECPSLPITLCRGGRPSAFLSLPSGVRSVELEPLIYANVKGGLSAPDGSDPDPVLRRRAASLIEHLVRLRPRAVLLEHFPFGRWAFRDEIIPLLEACRLVTPRPLVWSSVREIPILSDGAYRRLSSVARRFDCIFVHSDPGVLPLDLNRPTPIEVASRVEYTGFVSPGDDEGSLRREGSVLVHAGGGQDGKAFWEAFHEFRLHMATVQFKSCGENPHEMVDHRSMSRLLRSAWRSISMAGYNTVAEWLAFRTPTIFVPRRSDAEQCTRVLRIQERVGGPMMISAATPAALRAAWDGLRDDQPYRTEVWIKGQEHFAKVVHRHLQ
jgi:predicted glycosyltransferase